MRRFSIEDILNGGVGKGQTVSFYVRVSAGDGDKLQDLLGLIWKNIT